MTRAEADLLVAVLVAAFPHPLVSESTRALYGERLAYLRDLEAARDAIDAIIENETAFPPLAVLLREYRPRARRNADRQAAKLGLEEPPADPANAARARALLDRITAAIDERAAEAGLDCWEQNGNGNGEPGP